MGITPAFIFYLNLLARQELQLITVGVLFATGTLSNGASVFIAANASQDE
jgi:hypothetical protein